VIFVIRTRRIPFWKSRPSALQLLATLLCAGVGATLPYVPPLARLFGFTPLPPGFLLIVLAMIAAYLTLAELGKARFFRPRFYGEPLAKRSPEHQRRVHRRAARWTRRRLPPRRPARRT
jgi:Mg2+-importing ATPase